MFVLATQWAYNGVRTIGNDQALCIAGPGGLLKERAMTLKEMLLAEIETLPVQRQADVLAFVRFLKIGLGDDTMLDEQFAAALTQARQVAAERDITTQDIADEIESVRAN
jgi:hypothetical protein